MTSDDIPQYAELWKEQIDQEELAQLQAMGKNIERTAKWKRLLDVALAFAFIGPASFILWINPASLQTKFGLALLGAVAIGIVWRRHQITKASRATAIGDPRIFFEKTAKNVRAEISMSTISLCLGVPGFIACISLMGSLRGLSGIELLLLALSDENRVKTILILTIMALGCGYFVIDNIKLREQLRRLESMSREWDE